MNYTQSEINELLCSFANNVDVPITSLIFNFSAINSLIRDDKPFHLAFIKDGKTYTYELYTDSSNINKTKKRDMYIDIANYVDSKYGYTFSAVDILIPFEDFDENVNMDYNHECIDDNFYAINITDSLNIS